MKATEITIADKTKQKRREFVLDTDLQEGALLTELHNMFKKVKKPIAARITVSENIVGLVNHYYCNKRFPGNTQA